VPSGTRSKHRADGRALRPRREHAVGLFGVIDKLDGRTITLKSRRNRAKSLTVGVETNLIVTGKPHATVADLVAGDRVLALGLRHMRGKNAPFTPMVVIVAPSTYARANVLVGRVESVSPNQLRVKTERGDETLTLGSNTEIFGPDLTNEPVSALSANSPLLVLGMPSDDNGFNSQVIIALQASSGHRSKSGNPKSSKPKQK
jgi:hypothetical protein